MISLIRSSLFKFKINLSFMFIIYIIISLISILTPYLNGYFLDSLLAKKNNDFFIKFFLIYSIIIMINIVGNYYYSFISNKVKNEIQYDLHDSILSHIELIPYEKILVENPSYLHQRIEQDTLQITKFVVENFFSSIINLLIFISLIVFFYIVNIGIFVLVLIFIPIYLIMYVFAKKPLYNYSLTFMEVSNKYYGYLDKEYQRFRENRIYSDYKNRKYRMNNFFLKYLKSWGDFFSKSLFFSSIDQIVTGVFQIVILVKGGISIISGEMSIGEYTMLNTFFSMILSNLKYFFLLSKEYQISKASKDRINTLLNVAEENNGDFKIETINRIELEGINYNLEEKKFFKKNLYLNIDKPNIYYIIGENGSGKTTLINILIGLLKKNRLGSIKINGVSVDDIDMNFLRRKNISIMIQNEIFPELTVKEYIMSYLNIINLNEWFSSNNSISKLFISEHFNLLSQLEKKIQDLSSGEKQMLSMFSTLRKEADFYIFDEPTSNLHENIRKKFYSYIDELVSKDKIIIIITHDLESLNKNTVIISL